MIPGKMVSRAQRLPMRYLFVSRQFKTRKEAAAILGVNRAPIGAWRARYAAGGRDAVRERDVAAGKPSRLPPAVEAAVRAVLAAPTGFVSSGEMVEWALAAAWDAARVFHWAIERP